MQLTASKVLGAVVGGRGAPEARFMRNSMVGEITMEDDGSVYRTSDYGKPDKT